MNITLGQWKNIVGNYTVWGKGRLSHSSRYEWSLPRRMSFCILNIYTGGMGSDKIVWRKAQSYHVYEVLVYQIQRIILYNTFITEKSWSEERIGTNRIIHQSPSSFWIWTDTLFFHPFYLYWRRNGKMKSLGEGRNLSHWIMYTLCFQHLQRMCLFSFHFIYSFNLVYIYVFTVQVLSCCILFWLLQFLLYLYL